MAFEINICNSLKYLSHFRWKNVKELAIETAMPYLEPWWFHLTIQHRSEGYIMGRTLITSSYDTAKIWSGRSRNRCATTGALLGTNIVSNWGIHYWYFMGFCSTVSIFVECFRELPFLSKFEISLRLNLTYSSKTITNFLKI